jgi:hypothetical protein
VNDPALEEAVLAFVRERDWVTFAALHAHFAGDAREPTEIALPGNRVIWAGLPKPVIDAVLALLDAGRLAALPGNLAAYRRDGRVLALPVEKRPPREPHAEPHWFPVLLRPMERVLAEQPEEP